MRTCDVRLPDVSRLELGAEVTIGDRAIPPFAGWWCRTAEAPPAPLLPHRIAVLISNKHGALGAKRR
jgi:hypothetical protein